MGMTLKQAESMAETLGNGCGLEERCMKLEFTQCRTCFKLFGVLLGKLR